LKLIAAIKLILFGASLVLAGVLFGASELWARQSCTCQPTYYGGASDLRWKIVFSGVGTPLQQEIFRKRVQTASERWTEEFKRRGAGISVFEDNVNPTEVIRVDPNWKELPYNFHPGDTVVGPEYVTEKIPGYQITPERIIADIQHEFGHSLMYGDAGNCNGSLMGWDPNHVESVALNFTACDIETMFNAIFGEPKFLNSAQTDYHAP
jgi:hypothetical protein